MWKRKRSFLEYSLFTCKRTKYGRYLSNHDVQSGSNVPMVNIQSNHFSSQGQKPNAFCRLEDLIKLSQNNSNQVTSMIIAHRGTFTELLKSNLDPDWIVSTVAILSKVCSSSFTEQKFSFMSSAAKGPFTQTLEKYLMMLQHEEQENLLKNQQLLSNVDEFFSNLTVVFKYWVEITPTKDCNFLTRLLKTLNISIPSVENRHSVAVSDSTKLKIKTLIEKLNEKEKVEQQNNKAIESLPNDFRNLTVYPTCEEILSSKPSFFRKNIIQGSYDSVHDYFDVQFRLLKEDFLASLRKGMGEYLKRKRRISCTTKFSNITIFPDVVFRSRDLHKAIEGVTLDFSDEKTSKEIFSPDSKRFLTGSLILFTKDNFFSILCGRVIDINLKEKQIVVNFDKEYSNYELDVSYLMVECEIFFEPYYRVLKALQCMSRFDFPMKNYLIDAVPAVESPDYLDTSSSLYEIQSIKDVNLFGDNWPTADELQLDLTQYSAYKGALTQKCVVIQGPPGTGKTYVGLKIVKTLLCNSKFWYDKTPILIVALTNHALDQFLEGLMSTTKKILRIGSQSKNEKLTRFSLINARRKYKGAKRYNLWKSDMNSILEDLAKCNKTLKLLQDYTYVIAFKHFANIDQNIDDSWFAHASNSDLLAWLFPCERSINSQFNLETFGFTDMNDVVDGTELTILVSMSSIEDAISQIQNYLQDFNSDDDTQLTDVESYLDDLQNKLEYFKMKIEYRANLPRPSKPCNVDYHSPHQMNPKDRWNLYFYWLNLYKQDVIRRLVELKSKYENICQVRNKQRNLMDLQIMQKMLVVGMTTTAAARLHDTLQNLKCRIVIVEEAAQVLESHVTVSLTSHCQHLILIGDHQQLHPTTADYRIGEKFNLGISLFERMVMNKMQCHVLGVQRRMRPEIAELIVPEIYPDLKNHDFVYNFPPITGMDSNLFFIHHEHQEIQDGKSKSNLFEAEYLISFACYLRQFGYEPEDIVILAAYSGQMFSLRKEWEKHRDLLDGVRIEVVDNYQGEESEIILLSLVRNNHKGEIGFLRSEYRVCVALSRAKRGLYIMGNMDLLCKNSEIWPKIKKVLIRQNCLDNYLTVSCKFHSDQITKIKEPKDFDRALDGACGKKCGRLMNCGHNCTKSCHIIDPDHLKEYGCRKPCKKIAPECASNEHRCQQFCYKECRPCYFPVKKKLPNCKHSQIVDCSININSVKCLQSCNKILPCGHKCPKECYDACGGCRKIVRKTFPNCGHEVETMCKNLPNIKDCRSLCSKRLACRHYCRKKCYESCTKRCREMVDLIGPAPCDHVSKIFCFVSSQILSGNYNAFEPCLKACTKILECSHKCSGTCGTCYKRRFHPACTVICKIRLECGHECWIPCRTVGQPWEHNCLIAAKKCFENEKQHDRDNAITL